MTFRASDCMDIQLIGFNDMKYHRVWMTWRIIQFAVCDGDFQCDCFMKFKFKLQFCKIDKSLRDIFRLKMYLSFPPVHSIIRVRKQAWSHYPPLAILRVVDNGRKLRQISNTVYSYLVLCYNFQLLIVLSSKI